MTKKASPVSPYKSYTDVELVAHTQENLPSYRKFLEAQQDLLQKKETRTRGEKVKKMLTHMRTLDKYRSMLPKNFKPKDRLELEKALAFFDKLIAAEEKAKTPEKITPVVEGKNDSQKRYLQALRGTNDLVVGDGVAGTGKTFLAIAVAWERFKAHQIKKIVLTRPAVTAKESIGFIPGDIHAKMDPFLRPLFDALQEVSNLPPPDIEKMMEEGKIEIVPFAFMRGRTFKNAVVILDEAQNTTVEQIKMFSTRPGEGSQVFINGDTSQNDLPKTVESGLSYLLEALGETNYSRIAVVRFDQNDVVRSPLVKKLVTAFGKLDAKRSLNPDLSKKEEPKCVSVQPSTVQIVAEKIIVNTNDA